MTPAQALAVLIIALFVVGILWGRSAGGQETLTRLFGERAKPKKPTRSSGRSSRAKTPSRAASTASRPAAKSSSTARRSTARRGRRQ